MKEFWHRLSKRERGLVILTLVIVALFVGKYAVVTPLLERLEWTKSQLESQPRLLTKNLRYLGQRETLRASLEALRTQVKVYEAKLLTGDTSSVSASDLQETVQGLAAREGTQVITTRVLNPEPAGSFSKIGIQMEIGGQINKLPVSSEPSRPRPVARYR
jgi:type II secretory pathway component PulM